MTETLAARVIKYYCRPGVASLEIIDRLCIGDRIHITGHTTDFDQTVESLELNHEQIDTATKGQIVGLKVDDYVRKNDRVHKVID